MEKFQQRKMKNGNMSHFNIFRYHKELKRNATIQFVALTCSKQ